MIKGDVVLVPFPFTDLSGDKLRPALVLASVGNDVIVVFMTSRSAKKQNTTEVLTRADSQNRLKADSTIKCSKIATLDSKIIIGKLGKIKNSQIKEVDAVLKNILHLR